MTIIIYSWLIPMIHNAVIYKYATADDNTKNTYLSMQMRIRNCCVKIMDKKNWGKR